MRSRIAPLRNRREVRAKRLPSAAPNDTARIILPTNDTVKQNATDIDTQRLKRETPECVINYNSVRQLYVGCSQTNVIEVKPHCSDDGDEGELIACTHFTLALSILIIHLLRSVQLPGFVGREYNYVHSCDSFEFTARRLHKLSGIGCVECSIVRWRLLLSINTPAKFRPSSRC